MLRVRWTGQMTDGIFQSALASFILFSPERQANALGAALAFAVVLLPYSVIGPFVGTILDRVSRQRAIAFSNLIRAVTLSIIALLLFQGHTGIEITIFVLIAFGVNRLILAGLSAGIPLMIESKSLISANALAVTGGSVWVVLGGGIGLGMRSILDSVTNADSADGYIILLGAFGYLATSLLASNLKKDEIGPLEHEIKNASFTQGLIEMREGVKFLSQNVDAARGIAAVAVHRGGITALTLIALLLERNTFHDPADSEAGLAGLSFTLTIAACGFVVGAVIAPYGVRKVGRHRWMRLMLSASTLGPLFIVFSRTPLTLAIAAFVTALFGQSLKVTNDALVQSKIDDIYRGRVFSVYDVVVNGAIVSGAVIAALLLPNTGDSYLVPSIVAGIYFIAGARLLRGRVFFAPPIK
ncbi:MAG: MFS transporter [Actinobacteria bacterium]|nr:MFS transporter [Actinomycetota bacterium]MSV71576.1 MFS transporter [Actinomycetota bacterium]MSW14221.1 MFS transporter [Actinomycetota bacterium]MSX47396.1 MFS transporter [Actinomycetota bacterium]MSX91426.1 MFS transporter [Actinomycetota bacterium]